MEPVHTGETGFNVQCGWALGDIGVLPLSPGVVLVSALYTNIVDEIGAH